MLRDRRDELKRADKKKKGSLSQSFSVRDRFVAQ